MMKSIVAALFLFASASSLASDSNTGYTAYMCEDGGCSVWVITPDRTTRMHESEIDGLSIRYRDNKFVVISFTKGNERRSIITSLENASIEVRNGYMVN